MNKFICIILFVFFSNITNAQNIIGRWQAYTPIIGNEIDDNYQFFTDGTFFFNPDGQGKLSKVLKLCGTYKIISSSIVLTPTYYVEQTGGFITRTGAEPGTADWAFVDGKESLVKINKIIKQELPFKIYKIKGRAVIEIDFNKFYKIQNDPSK